MASRKQAESFATTLLRNEAVRTLALAARYAPPLAPAGLLFDVLKATTPKRATTQRATSVSAGAGTSVARSSSARAQTESSQRAPGAGRLDRNTVAKSLAGTAVRQAVMPVGIALGAWDMVKDAGSAGLFVTRLLDPNDAYYSPRGEAAWDEVVDGAKGLATQTQRVIEHPLEAMDRVRDGISNYRRTIDPAATPQDPTFLGELARNVPLGLNQGKLGFNLASAGYGGAELKSLRLAKTLGRRPTPAYFKAQGVPDRLADYFATPYTGRGHHYWPQKKPLPKWLGGGLMPPVIGESPFFLLKPPGMTMGEFHKRHFEVDPTFYGGRLPREFGGGGWSGKKLEWTKHGQAGRVFYGAPGPLKAAVGGGLLTVVAPVGAAVDSRMSQDEFQ